jgi:hypothetical protein
MQEKDRDPLFVGVEKLSRLISIPAYTIRAMARAGVIPGYKLTHSWLFDIHEVEKVIRSRQC